MSTEADRAEMANGLDKQQKNHASQCRGIVRHRPDQYQESSCPYQKDDERQSHLAIEKNERQSRQEQKSTPPEIRGPAACQFFNRNLANVLPGVLIVFAFPSIVEIFELLSVILNRLLCAVPPPQPCRPIGARVQGGCA